ncbi:SDR family oxidoreductase [Corynebacterium vitaeruminis]|uniref:SDR family oxidoreductase n=1 Tax=Corynebacterium vitaeruminis TaxID=38305 RepID=UPI0023F0D9AC|nr:DUF1731 domain-containing protein [Corynebacterium vitaeruminis]
MSISTTHIVAAPRELVWRWHEQPGAVARLTAPFFPLTPKKVSANLAEGTDLFSLPAGLRWESRHDLSGYVKGYRFTDVCVASPIRAFAQWRHVHSFSDHPDGTRISDEVTTRVPKSTLVPMFAYRQQQLIRDLAFATSLHERLGAVPLFSELPGASGPAEQPEVDETASGVPARPLTIAITGSRSTTGRALSAQLTTLGHTVIQLVRPTKSRPNAKPGQRLWDPANPDPRLLEGVDALVHLVGESLLGRGAEVQKLDSLAERIAATRRLADLVAHSPSCRVALVASAIGAYGSDRGEEPLTEESGMGKDELATAVGRWESAFSPAVAAGARVAFVRTGIVLSGSGGVLPVLRTLFSAGLGGSVSRTGEWFSWISLDDLTDIYVTALADPRYSGTINAVSPNTVRNNELASSLNLQLRRPASFPIPGLRPKALPGTGGTAPLELAPQRVLPTFLVAAEFSFRYPELGAALAHEVGTERLFDAS